jgi:hypothetical protein
MGVHLMGMHFTDVSHGHVPYGRASRGRIPHRYASQGHTIHGYAPYGRVCHEHIPYRRVCHGRVCHGRVCHEHIPVNGDAAESFRVNLSVKNGACSVNYGKTSAIYIHLQQILICCTACLQAPSILGCSIDISGCSTIVSYINHPAELLKTILIGLWWW